MRELLASEGVEDEIELRVDLEKPREEAERERFLGSPTIRVTATTSNPKPMSAKTTVSSAASTALRMGSPAFPPRGG